MSLSVTVTSSTESDLRDCIVKGTNALIGVEGVDIDEYESRRREGVSKRRENHEDSASKSPACETALSPAGVG